MKYDYKYSLISALAMFMLAGSAPVSAASAADAYPTRTIRFIVSFPPGGGNDFLARLLSAKLGETRGWSVVVENVPGAGGVPGTDAIAKAKPDGYTIGMGSVGTLTINPSLYKLPFDAAKDIAPVGCFSSTPAALVVPSDLEANTVAELIEMARSKPGSLNFGSAGNGTSHHLAAELFAEEANLNVVHIPYAGSGAAVTGLVRVDTQFMFSNLPAVIPHINSGKLKALAVTSLERSPFLPDVPALSETFPGFEVSVWYSIVAPANTPAPIIDKLNQAIHEVLELDDVKDHLENQGAVSTACSPAELRQLMDSERERWARVVERANIKQQ